MWGEKSMKQSTKNCLIVDDSKVVRTVARMIMEPLGLACVEVENGLKAFESCLEKMPDVILLDWNMPVMNGIEFLTRLRAAPGGYHPKVILCTTQNEFSSIQAALSAGADEYIMKPFDKEIVENKLELVGAL
jgi:two-component system chemotaxis response regulator CheY